MQIQNGKQDLPSKDLIYGVEGVGKTSLASTYPEPIFIDCEGSTTKLEVSRIFITNYEQFKDACRIVCGPEGANFKTVVFDTCDWLENIVINQILKEDQAKTITDKKLYSFGAGEKRVEEFFRKKIIPAFEVMLKQEKNVVLVAHAHIKGVDDPIVGRYDHYTLKMGKTASAVLREWVNNVFFMNYETKIQKTYSQIEKDRAVGGKEVYVYTQRTAQYNAKRRDKVADQIKFIEGVNPYPQIIGRKATPTPTPEHKPELKKEKEEPKGFEIEK